MQETGLELGLALRLQRTGLELGLTLRLQKTYLELGLAQGLRLDPQIELDTSEKTRGTVVLKVTLSQASKYECIVEESYFLTFIHSHLFTYNDTQINVFSTQRFLLLSSHSILLDLEMKIAWRFPKLRGDSSSL